MVSKRAVGNKFEDLACEFLQKKGYALLTRNFYIRGGEIDIIAMDGEELVFVEVKARSTNKFGVAEEAISYFKISSLKKAALFYINQINWQDKPYRFDLVAINYVSNNNKWQVNLIKNFLF